MSTKILLQLHGLLIIIMLLLSLAAPSSGALQVGFYEGKCGFRDVESIVEGVVTGALKRDRTLVAALLRLHFHDCFISGCDASLLLDGSNSEKAAPPNLSVRGYDLIDAVKIQVEKACPGVVSCADIIAMATRDAVNWAGGGRYGVETGRRDALQPANIVDLPGPSISVNDSIAAFSKRNLNVTDMVYLLGGHTVGVSRCIFFMDRLYNYKNTGEPDPTIDPWFLDDLQTRCPQDSDGENTVFLDQNFMSSFVVDNSFHKQISRRRGILEIDQQLALDPLTKDFVSNVAFRSDFAFKFGQAMIKMGRFQVLTGSEGEIRRTCEAVN
ncbi:peroxidase 60 [Benincasa hispida]|uniref:peroxidase 60 n=1 Tax=Benincasa hispida TaxID=102211 RepID=UPI00190010DA|nr:peroxidase 60 [Benincasa hispida]